LVWDASAGPVSQGTFKNLPLADVKSELGIIGGQWHIVNGVPPGSLGSDGDYCLNPLTDDIRRKGSSSAGQWGNPINETFYSQLPTATEAVVGKIQLASQAEVTAGTDQTKAVVSKYLQQKINTALVGAVEYKGTYNANTSTPTLVGAYKGDLYIVSHAGTLAGVAVAVGDHILFNQNSADPVTSAYFDVIDNSDSVSTVNTQVGNVVLDTDDISEGSTNLYYTDTRADARIAAASPKGYNVNTATANVNASANTAYWISAANVTASTITLPLTSGLNLGDTVTAARKNIGELQFKQHGSDAGTLLQYHSGSSGSVTFLNTNQEVTARWNGSFWFIFAPSTGVVAYDLVQLDSNAKLPAVDGSNLTNLPGGGGGGYVNNYKSETSSFTAVLQNHHSFNTTSGAIIATLPAAGAKGSEIRFKLITKGGSNNLTITPASGEHIDAVANNTVVLSTVLSSVTLIDNGATGWEVI
jgi:hypothetical protein